MSVRFLLLLTIFNLLTLNSGASENSNTSVFHDSLQDTLSGDSIKVISFLPDTFIDSLAIDSLGIDSTVRTPAKRKDSLKDKIVYSAEDSMMISVTGEQLYLYGKANVKYLDIDLTADYIMLDMSKEEVFATGRTDTTGAVIGAPVFKQDDESFDSDSLKYNFRSKKGIIYHIFTKEGEGYLHSEKTKRLADGNIDIIHGKYTTCDAKHPHFYIAMTKAIVIPEDKIVTGPAYMVVADVPFKFPFIPYGFFPNTTTRTSGIIIPSYGAGGDSRGFFLSGGGWYQVLGEHADVRLMGDIYSLGSWKIDIMPRYIYRYRFSGNLTLSYAENKNNDDITAPSSSEYKILWTHAQDGKASPGQSFSANVNYASSKYDQQNSFNPTDITRGVRSSNISFTKNWSGRLPLNLSLSANAVQTVQTSEVDMDMPTGSLNMGSVYPLRKKSGVGKYKWWENISVSYSSQFANRIQSTDSTLFTQETIDNMNTGFKHNIPLSVSFKLGKMITITPSLNYTGMLYTKYVEVDTAIYDPDATDPNDTLTVIYDTIPTTRYIHGINPTASISFTPKLYGMLISKKETSYIMAIRHVMSPSASFSFTPDVSSFNANYYDSISYKKDGQDINFDEYSIYENEMYGVPVSNDKSGSLSLSLNNNFEMKVRPRNDTTGEPKKVTILDNLNFSTSYNPFSESYKWSDVSMVTGTKLFKKNLNIRVNGRFTPYGRDTLGNKTNVYYSRDHNRLLRFTNVSVAAGFGLKSKQGQKKKSDQQGDQPSNQNEETDFDDELNYVPAVSRGQYADFSVPWSFTVDYIWSLDKSRLEKSISHSVSFRGDFSLAAKWKINFSGGFDIVAKKPTLFNIGIIRDIHCWEMSFNVIPFGKYAFYSFTINAKSSLLRDLKYDKKSDNRYDRY